VHLADLKNAHRIEHYRNNRLFYERPTGTAATNFMPDVETIARLAPAVPARLRVCVYTCLIGSTELLNEQSVAASSDIPFICLSDNPDRRSETWEVRPVSPLFEMDLVRSQRALKLLPHKYLPDFDASLYIDNGVLLSKAPEDLIAEHFPASGFCLPEHSFRSTVVDEFLAVSDHGLDDPSRIFEQLNQYSLHDPEVLQEKPYWTAILLRDHRNPAVRGALELWWAHVQRYSRRDQLSLNYVLRRCGLTPNVLSIDNYHSSYHSWPHKTPAHQPTRTHRPLAAYGTLSARIRELEVALAWERQQSEAQIAGLLEDKQRNSARVHELESLLDQETQRYALRINELAGESYQADVRTRELTEAQQQMHARMGQLDSLLSEERQRVQALHASLAWRLTTRIRKMRGLLTGQTPRE
jgi:hypothetical protein